MKKLLSVLLLTLASFSSNAQSYWRLTPVPDKSATAVGYIYHTYAVGRTEKNGVKSSVTAGLRFVCSVKSGTDAPPVVAIFWNGNLVAQDAPLLLIEVGGGTTATEKWTREGSLIYTEATKTSIVPLLKKGYSVKFSWNSDNGDKHTVLFSLDNFNLKEFNNSCKTQL